jgi:hypothetical protein
MASNIEKAAIEIAAALTSVEAPAVEAEPGALAELIAAAIKTNFEEEAAITRQAETTLASLPSTVGMDQGKLLAGIKERIAKQRNFVL